MKKSGGKRGRKTGFEKYRSAVVRDAVKMFRLLGCEVLDIKVYSLSTGEQVPFALVRLENGRVVFTYGAPIDLSAKGAEELEKLLSVERELWENRAISLNLAYEAFPNGLNLSQNE